MKEEADDSRKDKSKSKSNKPTEDTSGSKATSGGKSASGSKSPSGSNTAGGSGSSQGKTKFTKEVSSDQHTEKRRAVLPGSANSKLANAGKGSDDASGQVEVSPKLAMSKPADSPSPKRKGHK
ncbi:hypothetical protein F5Y06DRAFT_306999 [Hypoxylon sp. FL0890]|nr:hypothetical protein F5Y06DRAFT_306999 [Hypoxylon sp. FL0890]